MQPSAATPLAVGQQRDLLHNAAPALGAPSSSVPCLGAGAATDFCVIDGCTEPLADRWFCAEHAADYKRFFEEHFGDEA